MIQLNCEPFLLVDLKKKNRKWLDRFSRAWIQKENDNLRLKFVVYYIITIKMHSS